MADIVHRNVNEGVFHKHKKAKYEIAKQAVNSYLSKRHYTENEMQKRNVSFDQLLMTQIVEKETARPNSILYSNSSFRNTFNNDPNPIHVEPYFCKFITFVNNLPEILKLDLSKLISPLFCHLYLDLLQGSHQQVANLLLKYYQEQKGIIENELCSQVIKEFVNQDIKCKPVIKTFRSSKYNIKISVKAIDALKNFLAKNGHILIMHVFQTWFDIEITSQVCSDSDEEEFDNESCNGETYELEIDPEVQELKEIIASVTDRPPPVLLVNVFNSQENATCGIVNNAEGKAVVGFNTSDIYIWSIGSSILSCDEGVNRNASKITLGCDNIPPNAVNPYEESPLSPTRAVILRGHGESIQDVKIISEANVLMSVSQDRTMRAWRLSDYSCAAIYRGHNYPIWCLDVSIFGLYIATGSYDKTVRLWTLDRIYPIRVLPGHTKDVNCVQFHPNASYFATGSADKTVRMWDPNESKTVRLLVGHKGVVHAVSFSPDGHYLAAGDDKTVTIWDIVAAKPITELNGCSNTITGLSWSKDKKNLAAISLDGCVRVWDVNSAINNDSSNLGMSSVYNTGCNSLLSVSYNKNWITCLSASAVA